MFSFPRCISFWVGLTFIFWIHWVTSIEDKLSPEETPQTSEVNDQYDRFMNIYERTLKNSTLYKNFKAEQKLKLEKNIKIVRQHLKNLLINEEDADMLKLVKQLATVPDDEIRNIMNLLIAGKMFLGPKENQTTKKEEL